MAQKLLGVAGVSAESERACIVAGAVLEVRRLAGELVALLDAFGDEVGEAAALAFRSSSWRLLPASMLRPDVVGTVTLEQLKRRDAARAQRRRERNAGRRAEMLAIVERDGKRGRGWTKARRKAASEAMREQWRRHRREHGSGGRLGVAS